MQVFFFFLPTRRRRRRRRRPLDGSLCTTHGPAQICMGHAVQLASACTAGQITTHSQSQYMPPDLDWKHDTAWPSDSWENPNAHVEPMPMSHPQCRMSGYISSLHHQEEAQCLSSELLYQTLVTSKCFTAIPFFCMPKDGAIETQYSPEKVLRV